MSGDSDGRVLDVERVLPAPSKQVFEACVEPGQLAESWGPAGFTVLELDLDARVGGRYRITMQPPDGVPFRVGGAFRELSPPRRLVYTFAYEEPDPDHRETVVTLSLLERPHGTRLVLRQAPFRDGGPSRAARNGVDGDSRTARTVSRLTRPRQHRAIAPEAQLEHTDRLLGRVLARGACPVRESSTWAGKPS